MLPKSFYKYDTISVQSLHNLKSQVLYFGSPLDFNDPYDCSLSPIISPPSNAEIESIRKYYLANPDMQPKIKQEFLNASIDKLREMFMKVGRETIEKAASDFLNNRGVTCFSERNDNLVMWSHYGGHYKGFCLE